MRVSFNWLRDFLPNLPTDPTVVGNDLTRIGFEVEGTTTLGRWLSGLLVAEVLALSPHPQASKLRIVRVRAGAREEDVVCGAANVPAPGGKVCWAPPGAQLPGFTMAAKEIRGVMSPGMLCSEQELGLAEAAEGILILDATTPSGLDPVAHFGLADTVYEVNVTPNRADALSHLGLARELAVVYGQSLQQPGHETISIGGDAPACDVKIEDAKACARYQARVLSKLKVAPSPLAIRMRLLACGIRPISNLVDATNYVLLELGHPLHAFDRDKIKGAISVRKARPGERLVTLDGVDRSLESGDTVIADESGPVALAGVMGGAHTEISDSTQRVLLEAATFDPVAVRRTAKRLALHSESSHRFERGVDAEGIARASERAAALLCALGGGQQNDAVVDRYPAPAGKRKAFLSLSTLRRLSGDPARSLSAAQTTLERLCEDVAQEGQGDDARVVVSVPSYRPDINVEADLVEEVLRHEGYETVQPRRAIFNAVSLPNPEAPSDRARRRLVGAGFNEVITWGFVPSGLLAAMAPQAPQEHAPLVTGLRVANPISADYEVMRTSLLPGLVEAAKRNITRGSDSLRLFEVGPVVHRVAPPDGAAVFAEQATHAAALMCGSQAGWLRPGALLDFFDLKQAFLTVLTGFGFAQAQLRAATDIPYLHPGVAARVYLQDSCVGALGEIHPLTRKALRLDQPAFFMELYLDLLPSHSAAVRTALPPRFPAATRDISFWVDTQVSAQAQSDALQISNEPLLRQVTVLEDFRDPQYVPLGKKGMLWTLTYRSDERTLTDEEVDAAHAKVLAALKSAVSIELR